MMQIGGGEGCGLYPLLTQIGKHCGALKERSGCSLLLATPGLVSLPHLWPQESHSICCTVKGKTAPEVNAPHLVEGKIHFHLFRTEQKIGCRFPASQKCDLAVKGGCG